MSDTTLTIDLTPEQVEALALWYCYHHDLAEVEAATGYNLTDLLNLLGDRLFYT